VLKAAADGKVMLKTSNPSQFHLIQKTLLEHKIEFFTHKKSADRLLKIVLRGIPTDIPTDEVKYELEQLKLRCPTHQTIRYLWQNNAFMPSFSHRHPH